MIKSKEQGLLIVVSGPSGCGKSTLDQLLIERRKNIVMSISDTTRKPRGKEVNGVDYNFITPEEFKEINSSGKIFVIGFIPFLICGYYLFKTNNYYVYF